VLRLILAFVDIMLHRRGPEDLPSSTFFVWALFAVSLSVVLGIHYATGGTLREVAASVLIAFLEVWFVWALLRVFNREARFRQTMAAILGTSTILNIVSAPLLPMVQAAAAAAAVAAPAEPSVSLPVLVTWLIAIWSLLIGAFVFSRALERPYLLCLCIWIAYFFMMNILHFAIAPPRLA
jgi:hypothetical protein